MRNLKRYDEVVEVETGNIFATFEVRAKEVDASFSHHFGVQEVIELQVDEVVLLSFERWDEDGEFIVSKTPTKEELELLEEMAVEEAIES